MKRMMRDEKLHRCHYPIFLSFLSLSSFLRNMVLDAALVLPRVATVEDGLPNFSIDSIIQYLFTLFSILFTAEISEMRNECCGKIKPFLCFIFFVCIKNHERREREREPCSHACHHDVPCIS
jgi:hypothetical protein